MKIGIRVEGEGEFHALPPLLRAISDVSVHELFEQPLLCPLHPLAPTGQLALRAAERARILLQRGADRVILVLDHESRAQCPGVFAAGLGQAITKRLQPLRPAVDICVVMKVQAFENWLVSDPMALRPSRLPPGFRAAVVPDKADTADAMTLLKRWAKPKGGYHKTKDACSICQRIDPGRAGTNSRSFRRFLRLAGHPSYQHQSQNPWRSPS